MLPEGRINTTDEFMLPVRPGAIVVALKAGAPIVPCYIEGAPYRGNPLEPFPDAGPHACALRASRSTCRPTTDARKTAN